MRQQRPAPDAAARCVATAGSPGDRVSARAPAPPAAASATIPITSKSREAIAAFEKARAHADGGDAGAAVVEVEKALALDPDFALAQTQLDPAYYPAWQGLAQSRFLRGDWQGGREALVRGRNATKGRSIRCSSTGT